MKLGPTEIRSIRWHLFHFGITQRPSEDSLAAYLRLQVSIISWLVPALLLKVDASQDGSLRSDFILKLSRQAKFLLAEDALLQVAS